MECIYNMVQFENLKRGSQNVLCTTDSFSEEKKKHLKYHLREKHLEKYVNTTTTSVKYL